MGEQHRPGNRPKRAGKAPKNNPPMSKQGTNRPNSGASVGSTGRGTQHRSGNSASSSCPLTMMLLLPLLPVLLPYALARLAWDSWRWRNR